MNSSWSLVAMTAWGLCLGTASADTITNHPYQGVTYLLRTEALPRPMSMHIVLIDLAQPCLRFKLSPPGGSRDTIKQTTLDFLTQEQAQVAINAHFFLPIISNETNANVVGFAASQGVVYSPFEPQPVGTGYVDQSYAILPYAPALNIDPSNRASIVHFDPAFTDGQHVLEPVTLWNALSGSAQIVSNGVKSIPSYAGFPAGLNPINNYSDSNSWYSQLWARTAIGLTPHGEKLVLFTVDEVGGSSGMTVGEVADVLIADYQVQDALNLDGDGSTTLVIQDPITHTGQIVNAADFPFRGRLVGSSLAVFAPPNSQPPVILSIRVISRSSLVLSWPSPANGLRLQESSDCTGTNWTDVTASPQCLGSRMEVSLAWTRGDRFYRLIK